MQPVEQLANIRLRLEANDIFTSSCFGRVEAAVFATK